MNTGSTITASTIAAPRFRRLVRSGELIGLSLDLVKKQPALGQTEDGVTRRSTDPDIAGFAHQIGGVILRDAEAGEPRAPAHVPHPRAAPFVAVVEVLGLRDREIAQAIQRR